ncbi:MAG: GntR family transcriptional regulator [Clostridia bacterium]|nr:GntR family transcriptional regulator [Clostridia bacterium]
MNILISNLSGVPIYEQIEEQIKAQIMSGALCAGDALPSMRMLAKELKISVITTKRAYEDLERDGYISNVQGKGCFVKAMNAELIKENMLFAIGEIFESAADKAIIGKITLDELCDTLKIIYEEKNNGRS